MKIALSIAGSDPSAGAGIQADIKTFSALGVYGCTALTVLTAQNTRSIVDVSEVSSALLSEQISSILSDMPPNAIKIGIVYSKQIIDIVYRLLKTCKVPIVLDPIFTSSTGAKLICDNAYDSFISELVRLCNIITPNMLEAEKLAGIKIKDKSDSIEAAKRIRRLGARNVIIKGGHFSSSSPLSTDVTDILLDCRGKLTQISNARVKISDIHGSGCNFSAALTAYLAKGTALTDACKMANEYVHNAIKNTFTLGKGLPIVNPIYSIVRDAERYKTLSDLQKAIEQLVTLEGFYRLIPETQTNFVYALSDAMTILDVAGVRGRIVRLDNSSIATSYVQFGTSQHVAAAIIAYMKVNPSFRSAINIRFDKKLLQICKSIWMVEKYDRRKEPYGIKEKEGSTISWGTFLAISRNSKAEVIYHTGEVGKEPMIIVFGKNPPHVIEKIETILKKY